MWQMPATKCPCKLVDSWLFKGALSGLSQFLTTENPLKNDEKCFSHLKSSFRSQDM